MTDLATYIKKSDDENLNNKWSVKFTKAPSKVNEVHI